jgi:AraC family transcriptional regulator, exoenzyme S synthesis regulatory protein ExsA
MLPDAVPLEFIFLQVNHHDLFNLYREISGDPIQFRRFICGESLLTIYNCGLNNKYEDVWSHHNYIIYVVEGRKVWHTTHGSYDLREGDCVFVRKGACIVEQFFDSEFCFLLFFIPDEFIYEVLKKKSTPIQKSGEKYEAVIAINNNAGVKTFFQSMMAYFDANTEPDQSLLELKFRELVLTIATNPKNGSLISYFASLMREPHSISLQMVMEENFRYNLKLEEFARLCSRSLSSFKRDFLRLYNTSPSKWLMEKRLNYARFLLTNLGKTVAEAAFESGFESASHFSYSFRTRFGTSPVSFRNEASK